MNCIKGQIRKPNARKIPIETPIKRPDSSYEEPPQKQQITIKE